MHSFHSFSSEKGQRPFENVASSILGFVGLIIRPRFVQVTELGAPKGSLPNGKVDRETIFIVYPTKSIPFLTNNRFTNFPQFAHKPKSDNSSYRSGGNAVTQFDARASKVKLN